MSLKNIPKSPSLRLSYLHRWCVLLQMFSPCRCRLYLSTQGISFKQSAQFNSSPLPTYLAYFCSLSPTTLLLPPLTHCVSSPFCNSSRLAWRRSLLSCSASLATAAAAARVEFYQPRVSKVPASQAANTRRNSNYQYSSRTYAQRSPGRASETRPIRPRGGGDTTFLPSDRCRYDTPGADVFYYY